jgi:hypothetical protein
MSKERLFASDDLIRFYCLFESRGCVSIYFLKKVVWLKRNGKQGRLSGKKNWRKITRMNMEIE